VPTRLPVSFSFRSWQLKRDAEQNRRAAAEEREAGWYDKMDFDGYALM
jgi:hypothetical protein